ncbi:MAG: helix-turn-helix domain-containing protein [Defluviitaleaceae bacterium]|nr:helix-turn-helix domain-containing protein [Defluviitaleaceae bacterium]
MTLGNRINEYRRQRNITQEQLADAMGVSSQAVSKWENDISCPDISVMPQLADYFNVTLDRLVRGEEPMRPQVLQGNAKKDINTMILRIVVDSAGGDKVRVNLPIALIIAGLEVGLPLANMNFGNSGNINNAINQIDFNQIITLVESGMVGNIVEVESADGDNVSIFVE